MTAPNPAVPWAWGKVWHAGGWQLMARLSVDAAQQKPAQKAKKAVLRCQKSVSTVWILNFPITETYP
ncbi:hypothetical protein [Polaromonas sp. A23]|uniref:hypothetical protein n=1 Tax=Polaromonas sp. A23 TaxID=1944133 RepID=UPI00111549FD|nr:hypothetical protein [Polaromonas sp. A23]